jgi:hypothetical protein
VPFMRRNLDGRWQVGDRRAEPDEPIDPDARVVTGAAEARAPRR